MRAPVPAATLRTPRDLAPYLDHTLLAPGATEADVARVCEEARAEGFAAVCLRPEHVPQARRLLAGAGARIAAVVDFPRGEGTTEARLAEARAAVLAGAGELDLVAPLPAVRGGRWAEAFEDLRRVIGGAGAPVKVILETGVLGPDAKAAAAAIARAAGAAYLKTCTGFGGGGATVEDVALLRAIAGDAVGVKASGGIRTADDALAMIRAGASRIGSSSCVAIVHGAFGR